MDLEFNAEFNAATGQEQTRNQLIANHKEFGEALRHPFLWSYFGGRIESASIGHFDWAIDHDANSAYPAGMTRLPDYSEWGLPDFYEDELTISRAIKNQDLGQYQIAWNFPANWDYYPFPFRNLRGGIRFPQKGKGWVLSPELFSVIETVPNWRKYVNILTFFGWVGKGYGNPVKELPETQRSKTGNAIFKLMSVRLTLKKLKDMANIPLKLIMNSLYGKAIQQKGRRSDDLGIFNSLLGSWATSFTRSMIWRAMKGHYNDHTIIAIQTDGVLATTRLDVEEGEHLGQWEVAEYTQVDQIMPGVYSFFKDGKPTVKKRGFGGKFSFEDLKTHAKANPGKPYPIYSESTFITRSMSIIQHEKLGRFALQWIPTLKTVGFDIASKRDMSKYPNGVIWDDTAPLWIPPYKTGWHGMGALLDWQGMGSLPYVPHFWDSYTEDELMQNVAFTDASESEGFTDNIHFA